jgi:general L-amino acid transport system permease protein
MLWISAVVPFVAYFLIWGGSVWGPVAAALGFVLGYVAFRLVPPAAGSLAAVAAAIVVPLAWWLFLAGPFAFSMNYYAPMGMRFVQSKDIGGFTLAIIIGLSGITLSLPLGILLALGRQSDIFIINKSRCLHRIHPRRAADHAGCSPRRCC